MNYNLHPIFVHFPVALLFIYSFLKLIPLKRWLPNVSWKHIEKVVLLLGLAGASAALVTGDQAEHLIRTASNRHLIEEHSFYAELSTFLFGLLFVGEFIDLLHNHYLSLVSKNQIIKNIVEVGDRVFSNKVVTVILVLLALLSLFVAGLLGGAIIYGTSADPLAEPVLKLLGITL